MIVPFAKTPSSQGAAPAQPPPSEAALLMALAEMHKQGRFDVAQVRPGAEDNRPVANTPDEHEAAVRKHGEVVGDPEYPSVKKFMNNLPSDIEAVPRDDGLIRLRLKKEVPTS